MKNRIITNINLLNDLKIYFFKLCIQTVEWEQQFGFIDKWYNKTTAEFCVSSI